MSQHDFEITTADANTGPSVRAAINAAMQALASNNSGATEPSTTYAYQWWSDTTTGIMKQRNAADTAWIARGLLASEWVTTGLGEMPSGVEFTGDIVGGSFSMNSSDATNDTDFGSIVCMDSTNTSLISSTSTITKRLDAAWAVGTGNGGLANGSKAVSTIYHLYAILKTSDNTVDFMYLANGDAIATYIPAGYAKYKWVGFVRTNAAGAICGYSFNCGTIKFFTASENVLSSTIGVTAATVNHAAKLPVTRIREISYAAGLASSANDNIFAIDTGSNISMYIGQGSTTSADTDTTAWGHPVYTVGGFVDYRGSRKFYTPTASQSLLCSAVKLIR
ncbi:MAG: hypothetical protein KJ630_19140 [Proteobacteria bacterium]|nr:hypothetical protein [Pseudomonadota bacterium]